VILRKKKVLHSLKYEVTLFYNLLLYFTAIPWNFVFFMVFPKPFQTVQKVKKTSAFANDNDLKNSVLNILTTGNVNNLNFDRNKTGP
jgi:hypothetical protein